MYVVETYTLVDGWVNTWSVDGKAMSFATQDEAARELFQHASDLRSAGMSFESTDYRIRRVRR